MSTKTLFPIFKKLLPIELKKSCKSNLTRDDHFVFQQRIFLLVSVLLISWNKENCLCSKSGYNSKKLKYYEALLKQKSSIEITMNH